MAIYKNNLDNFIEIPKALGDPQRVRILAALKNRELCLCQVVELLGLAQSTVSKHMSVLKQAGLVRNRKEERWMYYRLPERPSPTVEKALEWMLEAAGGTDRIKSDEKKLKNILCVPKEKICRDQKN